MKSKYGDIGTMTIIGCNGVVMFEAKSSFITPEDSTLVRIEIDFSSDGRYVTSYVIKRWDEI